MLFRLLLKRKKGISENKKTCGRCGLEPLEGRYLLAALFDADFSKNGDGFPPHSNTAPPVVAPPTQSVIGGSATAPEGRWTLSYESTPTTDSGGNLFEVVNGTLRTEDWGGQARFESFPISIPTGATQVDIAAAGVTIDDAVQNASTEFFEFFYRLDGAPEVTTAIPLAGDTDGTPVTYFVPGLDVSSATSMTVGFSFRTNGHRDGYSISNFEVRETESSAAGVTIMQSDGTTDVMEGGEIDVYEVVLDASPAAGETVTVTAIPDGQVDLGAGPATAIALTFDASNWSISQSITVTAFDDPSAEPLHTGTITHTTTSGDAAYQGLTVVDVTVQITDNDAPASTTARINEFVNDQPGSGPDSAAFVEILDTPSASLSGLTLLQIEGDGGSEGKIDSVIPLTSTDTEGFETVSLDAENGSVTLMIVDSFTGALGDDIDSNDDGIIDHTPWAVIVDSVAVLDSNGVAYSATVLTPGLDGNSAQYDGASRFPNGTDTDSATDWIRNNSQGEGLGCSSCGLAFPGQALATPGALNKIKAGVIVRESPPSGSHGGSTDVAEGATTDTIELFLASLPTDIVTVTVTPDIQIDLGSGAGVPIELAFDAANSLQSVNVTANDDLENEGLHSGLLTYTVSSPDGDYHGLSVTTDDGSQVSTTTVTITDNDFPVSTSARINEFVADHSGSDVDTFVEIYDTPSTSLMGLSVLEIEGDATNRGVIEHVQSLTMTDANGFESFSLDAENGTIAFLLVANFTGNLGDDLDVDDDGIFDVTPWSAVIDSVATVEDSSDFPYSTAALFPGLDGVFSQYGGASRIPNGNDSNSSADWVRNDTQQGLPSFPSATGIPGRAVNTRGASNQVIPLPPGVTISQSLGSTDVAEGGPMDSYTVALNSPLAAGDTVSITVWPMQGQLDLGNGTANAITLAFDEFNSLVPQTVTVAATDDVVVEGPHTDLIGHLVSSTDPSYHNIGVSNVEVTIADNDFLGIQITESAGSTDIAEGGATDTYEIALGSAPTANVDVILTPNAQIDLGTGAGKSVTVTFTPNTLVHTVTAVAVDDTMIEDTHHGTITHTSSSSDENFEALSIRDVVANITDNDEACSDTSSTAIINEFVADHNGSDVQAFVEILDAPNACLNGLALLEIEGDGNFGLIDEVRLLTVTDANGFAVESLDAENGTVTFLLVNGFTGEAGDDVDADDDGTMDFTPWNSILDEIATVEDPAIDMAYTTIALTPGLTGTQFGGASRIPNGTDTNTLTDWVRNNYAGAGLPGPAFSDVLASAGEAINTPGAGNRIQPNAAEFTPTEIFIRGSSWAASVTSYQLTNNHSHSGASGHHGQTLPWAHLDTITIYYSGEDPVASDLTLSDRTLATSFIGATDGTATWTVVDTDNPLASIVAGVTDQIGPKDDLKISVSELSVTIDVVPGDIDGSRLTDIADILHWVTFLGAETSAIPPLPADVDGSGLTDVADVNAIALVNGAASSSIASARNADVAFADVSFPEMGDFPVAHLRAQMASHAPRQRQRSAMLSRRALTSTPRDFESHVHDQSLQDITPGISHGLTKESTDVTR